MITIKNDTLVISISTTEPMERRGWLIKAIAASMRWNAYADKTNDDEANQVVLAELLEELVLIENDI